MKQSYLIIDIGTGNVRVAITNEDQEVLGIETDIVHYENDNNYPSALSFNPDKLWIQIEELTKKLLKKRPSSHIKAITVSSQREGVVLMNNMGDSLIGLPNHDHRGREWEETIKNKDLIYKKTGRYPSSLFSAFKIIGIRKRHPEIYSQFSKLLSISDWAQFKLSGKYSYEHSQASETLLYDIEEKNWSSELCSIFDISNDVLPNLYNSGEVLGTITESCSKRLNISPKAQIIVGGADTQLAAKSTLPSSGDIIIVSGTTTPVVKIIDNFVVDSKQRTWTNRHTDSNQFILEANAGVTGLNYQRLKNIFYPNESYDQIEKEMSLILKPHCNSLLGSLIPEDKQPMTKGGFIFEVPVSNQLTRSCFMWSTLFEIACCIKENYKILQSLSKYDNDYIWACGGGFQSSLFRQMIASLLNKKVRIRKGYRQASVIGGAFICNETLNSKTVTTNEYDEICPKDQEYYIALYDEWKKNRKDFNKTN